MSDDGPCKNLTPKDFNDALEAIHHEAFGLDMIVGTLVQHKIEHEFTLDDLNLNLLDRFGVPCEVDFRIMIEGSPVLFGATRFNFNSRDLSKDFRPTDIPIFNVKAHGVPIPDGRLRITGVQSRASSIRRKLSVRIAREGRHEFGLDYVYIMFLYDSPRDVWPGAIPATFEFEAPGKDSYFLKEWAFSGICLVGALVKGDATVDTSGFSVRTHTFGRAGKVANRLLAILDRAEIYWR